MTKRLVGNVLFGFDREVAEWVAARVPYYKPDGDTTGLGLVHDGRLVGGAVYDNWNGVNVSSTFALDEKVALRRDTLFMLFNYPFGQLGCRTITNLVASSNVPSLNLTTKLGFEPEAIVRFAAHDGSDMIVLKMWKERCRWLSYGKKGGQRAEVAGSLPDGEGGG